MKVTYLTFQLKRHDLQHLRKKSLKTILSLWNSLIFFLIATVVQISLRHGLISHVLRISYRLLVSINRSSVLFATIF